MNDKTADEERILRVWTPIILRTILVSAIIILLVGLLSMAWQNPGYYVARFHALQKIGHLQNRESVAALVSASLRGEPRPTMTLGLMVLTLVRWRAWRSASSSSSRNATEFMSRSPPTC